MNLRESNLFIVDTETTGMNPLYHRVIEIGIIRVENGKIVDTFRTLLNPHRSLSPFIEEITAITAEELEDAPEFSNIIDRVRELSRDAIFVAHNAAFDYGFLKTEFKRYGEEFHMKQLCTVKLSRLLYPTYRHHDLSSIISRHNLTCKARHRAYDDAKALWDFMQSAEKELGRDAIDAAVARLFKLGVRPSHLSPAMIESLHEGPGVYILRDAKGKELYIGKSVNIKERLLSHFQDIYKSGRKRELLQLTKDIECIPCAGEFEALLLESELIKSAKPFYNIKSREKRVVLWLEQTTDDHGYFTPVLRKTPMNEVDMEMLLGIFKTAEAAHEVTREISANYMLCHKVMGVEKMRDTCFNFELGKCAGACAQKERPATYNARFEIAFKDRKIKKWPYKSPLIIKEQSPESFGDGTRGVGYVIDKWRLVSKIRYEGDFFEEEPIDAAFDLETYQVLAKAVAGKFKNLTIQPLPMPRS